MDIFECSSCVFMQLISNMRQSNFEQGERRRVRVRVRVSILLLAMGRLKTHTCVCGSSRRERRSERGEGERVCVRQRDIVACYIALTEKNATTSSNESPVLVRVYYICLLSRYWVDVVDVMTTMMNKWLLLSIFVFIISRFDYSYESSL